MKKHIPNFITLLNLFFGLIAVISALQGMLLLSAIYIGVAALMDFFDGLAARMLNVSSDIGKELDSLADMVSFGVAPGLIAFQLITGTGIILEIASVNILPFTGLIIPVFSALRLAKFNIDATQSSSFKGLPVPANALFFASLPFVVAPVIFEKTMLHQVLSAVIENGWLVIVIALLFSFLLVSPFRLFSLKFNDISWKTHKIQLIFIVLSLILLIVFNFAAIPVIIIVYILMSLLFYREDN